MIATIILALHLLGFMPLSEAVILLFIAGGMLILADIFVISLGILSVNGIIALIIGYLLHDGQPEIFGFTLDWSLFFSIAILEMLALGAVIFAVIKNRNNQASIGMEAMIGAEGSVIEWDGQKGRVHVQGEPWKATSESPLDLQKDSPIKIKSIKNLTLVIESIS